MQQGVYSMTLRIEQCSRLSGLYPVALFRRPDPPQGVSTSEM
jgi:hypothetical protein